MISLNLKFNLKKILTFTAMSAILLFSHFTVWGDTIVLAGAFAILLHVVKNFRFLGWVAALAYPITYWISSILDRPAATGVFPNNLYVYWYLSYIGIVIITLIVDIVVKLKNSFVSH